jgi:type IX secretion system PorP/SprF family membrane protein
MKKLFIPCFLLWAFAAVAQQDHQYTQFMYNKLLVNPAYAGTRGVPSLTAIYRNQWAGFDGAPQSALLSLSSPFLSPRVGVGAVLSHQQAGLQRDFFGNLAYSYDLIAGEQTSLRVGVQGSIRSLSLNFSEATTADPGGPGIDPSLMNQRVNDIYGNVGAGVYATFMQRYYVGFSLPRIYSNVIGLNNDPGVNTAKEYRHYYGTAGAVLPLSDGIKFLPAVLIKYVDGAPLDADLNLNLDVNDKFTFGISGRLGGDSGLESVDLLAYWQATPQVGIGAAYDFALSRVRDYTAGSFEVLLQADLKKQQSKKGKKGKKNLANPRFFL